MQNPNFTRSCQNHLHQLNPRFLTFYGQNLPKQPTTFSTNAGIQALKLQTPSKFCLASNPLLIISELQALMCMCFPNLEQRVSKLYFLDLTYEETKGYIYSSRCFDPFKKHILISRDVICIENPMRDFGGALPVHNDIFGSLLASTPMTNNHSYKFPSKFESLA